MKTTTSLRTLPAVLSLLLYLAFSSAYAQPLRTDIRSIDALGLPEIRLQVEMTWYGKALPFPSQLLMSLIENGKPIDILVDCPDSAIINSTAFVLDNSGSMAGEALDSVKSGSKGVVSGMRSVDEGALFHFSNGGEMLLDFTSDKLQLINVIDAMTSGANTPIYHTTMLGLQALATRTGKKYCIVFTDGLNNGYPETPQEVVDYALANGIRIYTIGYGNGYISDIILSDMARQTGGFYRRIFAPGAITEVFHDIGEEINSPYCTVTYTADNCEDSLRILHLETEYEGEYATDDSVFASPFRKDTLIIRVTAPDRIGPDGKAIVYMALEPGLHRQLILSFSFLLRFDPNLIEVFPVIPITVGTITQNTRANVRKLREGVLEFSASFVTPGMASGNLIGVVLTGKLADSSRSVPIEIDSMTITAGCPNIPVMIPDTIDICQCVETALAAFDTSIFVVGDRLITLPLRWSFLSPVSEYIVRSRLRYDADVLELIGVESSDAVVREDPAGQATILGRFRMPAGTIAGKMNLVFMSHAKRDPGKSVVSVPEMTMYADCCYDADVDSSRVIVDGECNPLLRRVTNVNVALYPNPAASTSTVLVRVAEQNETGARPSTIRVYSLQGVKVYERQFEIGATGQFNDELPLENLSPGQYYVVVSVGTDKVMKSLNVQR